MSAPLQQATFRSLHTRTPLRTETNLSFQQQQQQPVPITENIEVICFSIIRALFFS
jgi:hypothetical protein